MFTKNAFFHKVNVILLIATYRFVNCEHNSAKMEKFTEAKSIAQDTTLMFMNLFDSCTESTMTNQKFSSDNLHKYIVSPPRTTVGHMPKFTGNRKFFANMLSSLQFKEMLSNDEKALQAEYIRKLRYCDGAIMNPHQVREFYDREVDQAKI